MKRMMLMICTALVLVAANCKKTGKSEVRPVDVVDVRKDLIKVDAEGHMLHQDATMAMLTAFRQLASKGIEAKVRHAFRSPEEHYQFVAPRCECLPIDKLPQTFAPDDLSTKKLCKRAWNECGAAYDMLYRMNGVMLAVPLDHFSGAAVDVTPKSSPATQPCDKFTGPFAEAERKSKGVAEFPPTGISRSHCVTREQQLVIKAMLENGFCVGLKAGLRIGDPWHFEHVATMVKVSGKVGPFCTNDLSDANLRKLVFLQEDDLP